MLITVVNLNYGFKQKGTKMNGSKLFIATFGLIIVGVLFRLNTNATFAQTKLYLPGITGLNTSGNAAQVTATPTKTTTAVATATTIATAVATATPTTPATPVSNACPSDKFIDVQPDPANSAYPAPQLSVTCNSTQMTVQTNNIPNFEFVQVTPNQLKAQNYTFHFPLQPTVASSPSSIPLGGPSALTVNGLVIFGPTEAPRDGYRDPYLDGILDYCNGHTAPSGDYHFHARMDCIYPNLDQPIAANVGRVLGYAFDGYPILAPYLCADTSCATVKELQSSWKDVNPDLQNAWERHQYVAGSGDLDQCNGAQQADGSYAYYATDSFPYFMGCYHGVVEQSN
jgi:hypothetical protein